MVFPGPERMLLAGLTNLIFPQFEFLCNSYQQNLPEVWGRYMLFPVGGRYRADLGNRRGMRDAHLAQPCRVGLKLRFVRRPMTAQGLRPPPADWEGCFAAW